MDKRTQVKRQVARNNIDKFINKMLLTKEAVASCALDGETQCGNMTIESKVKETKDQFNKILNLFNEVYNSGYSDAKKDMNNILNTFDKGRHFVDQKTRRGVWLNDIIQEIKQKFGISTDSAPTKKENEGK